MDWGNLMRYLSNLNVNCSKQNNSNFTDELKYEIDIIAKEYDLAPNVLIELQLESLRKGEL